MLALRRMLSIFVTDVFIIMALEEVQVSYKVEYYQLKRWGNNDKRTEQCTTVLLRV
jgi:hypothetical protein